MKKVIALLLVLALVFTLGACGKAQDDKDTQTNDAVTTSAASDLEYIKGKGKLVVGITEFEPMDYKDATGNWIGFDADMATAFAQSLGIEVEFVVIDWDRKTFELEGKTIDCVWNGMTLTDEVTSAMECSKPYFNNAQVVIVPAVNADKYQTVEACKELQFAVEAGSAGKAAAEENGFNFTEVDKQATALTEVKAMTSDAAIIDFLMAKATVGAGTGYADLTYTAKLSSEEYGVGFRKGSDAAAALNEFFAQATADGTMEKIATNYGIQEALIK